MRKCVKLVLKTITYSCVLSVYLGRSLHIPCNPKPPPSRILHQYHSPEPILQSTLFEPTNLPTLPPPSVIEHWLYESPWIIAIVLGIICIAGLISTRHIPKAKKIALAMCAIGFLIAAGFIIVGTLVTTDREVLTGRSAQLVHAAASADETQLAMLLDEHISFQAQFGSQRSSHTGRSAIISLAAKHAAPMIESIKVKEVRAGLFGPRVARTHIKIRIESDLVPPNSWWLVDWTRHDSGDWIVTHIEPLWIQGLPNF